MDVHDFIGLASTIMGMAGTVSVILWRMSRDRKMALEERDKLVTWRTQVDGRLDRLDQWRAAVDKRLEEMRNDVLRIVRRLDKGGINGD